MDELAALALRAAIRENPCDDEAWTVYADLMEESGHPCMESVRTYVNALRSKDEARIRAALFGLVRAARIAVSDQIASSGGHEAHCSHLAETAFVAAIIDASGMIVETAEFIDLSNETHAIDWEMEDAEPTGEPDWEEWRFRMNVSFSARGQQLPSHTPTGNRITGSAVGVIRSDGSLSFTDILAEVEDPERCDHDDEQEADEFAQEAEDDG